MNDIQIFNSSEFGNLTTLNIDGEDWFIGKEVAEMLGYENTRKAIIDHVDEEDKGVTKCDTLGGKQDMTIINESGLYALIFGSKLEKAKRFKRWVTSEVLPSLRRTGRYDMSEPTIKLYCGHPVVTCRDIDTQHGLPQGTAARLCEDRRSFLEYGRDYWIVPAAEYIHDYSETYSGQVALLTETAYRIISTPNIPFREQRNFIMKYLTFQPTTTDLLPSPSFCTKSELIIPNKKARDAIDLGISSFASVYNYYANGGRDSYTQLVTRDGFKYLNDVGAVILSAGSHYGLMNSFGKTIKPDETPFFIYTGARVRKDGCVTLPKIGTFSTATPIVLPPDSRIKSATVRREGAKTYTIEFNTGRK